MRQITTTAFLGMLALTITGCPSSDNPQTTNPSPSVSPTPVVVVTPPATKPPLVPTNPTSAAYLAPGLIQPTNANQRTKQVAKGNQDPFAALFLPVPTLPASARNSSPYGVGSSPYANSPSSAGTSQAGSTSSTSGQSTRRQTSSGSVTTRQSRPSSVAVRNSSTTTARNSRTTINQRNSTNTATSTPNLPSPNNAALPDTNLPPTLPPAPPDTALANGVMVMGIIQIGEQTQAIVQVPSEATSRYVQVGQRLSNGQILVKRIELTPGLEPIVILEQYGVEVSKAVGEQSPNQQQQTTPAAILPLRSPSPSTATAAIPFLPPQNTRTDTAELPPPPQNINPVGTISVPQLQPANPITPALVK